MSPLLGAFFFCILFFSGIHVINSSLLGKIRQQGKFSMVDVYLSLANLNFIVGFDHTGTRFLDVGKPGSLQMANDFFH
jgi:NDP-sugar pyrophosphorylase family protein